VTIRIQGAGVWSNPKIYPWIAAPFLIVLVLVFAAKQGRRGGDPEPGRLVPAPPASAAPIPLPQALQSADDIPGIYLFLIDALDRGLERGEFSKESHALIRSNLKRRLEAIVSDLPRTGTR
jgi:hypothetical protein